MKKKFRLILSFAIVILIIAFLCSQANNIKGFLYSFKYSGDEIETMLADNDSALKEQVETFLGHSIREFTEEEQSQIKEGSVTEDEMIEKIITEEIEKTLTPPSDDKPVTSTTEKPEKVKPESDGKQDPVPSTSAENPVPPANAPSMGAAKYITELYNLKSEYLGKLDGMVESAVKEFRALPKKEKTHSKQLQIGASYVTKAMALESECDKKVAAIVSSLEKQLKAEGKSTAIITVINNAYNSEKTLKRAYYLNMFK